MAINAEQLLYRSPGGIGRYTAQLITVLPACFAQDEVVPLTARHPRPQIESVLAESGAAPETVARTVILPLPRPVLWEAWVRVGRPRLPALPGIDLVHAPSVAVPPRDGRPLVVTVHDAAAELFPEAFTKRGLRFHRQAMRAVAARADVVITGSQAAAAEITEHTSIGAERLRVVPYAVVPGEVDTDERQAFLRARGLLGREFVFWAGSLEPRKGVETLVAAMAEVRRRDRGRDVLLVLAGFEGWLNNDLIDPVDEAALGPALRHLGRLGDRELWALYGAAALVALPSRHEGFGLPVLEAMSQGVPVVASDLPAVSEVAGGAARLVAPGDVRAWADAITDLLADSTERRRLGQAGLARSAGFSAEAMATGTRAVYAEVAR